MANRTTLVAPRPPKTAKASKKPGSKPSRARAHFRRISPMGDISKPISIHSTFLNR